MTGLLVAIIVGGIWLILSAVILVSVCISSSRFNQEEYSVLPARKAYPEARRTGCRTLVCILMRVLSREHALDELLCQFGYFLPFLIDDHHMT